MLAAYPQISGMHKSCFTAALLLLYCCFTAAAAQGSTKLFPVDHMINRICVQQRQ